MEPGRDDRGEPAGQQRGQGIGVHNVIMVIARSPLRGSAHGDEDQPAPTPRYRRVLANSTEVAREMGHSYVGVEHLFLAIIRDLSSVPAQALAARLDLHQVEASLVQEMASAGYDGQAPPHAVWFPSSELGNGWPLRPRVAGTAGTWRVTRRGSPLTS